MQNSGFIVIQRKITEWGWYSDVPVKTLFLHLILTANWKPGVFKGIQIERGQKVTSFKQLSTETGLSLQQARTALEKLKATGEVTHEPHANYSIITVKNYSMYQDTDTEFRKQSTRNRHAKRQASNINITSNNTSIITNKKTKEQSEPSSQTFAIAKSEPRHEEFLEDLSGLSDLERIRRLQE